MVKVSVGMMGSSVAGGASALADPSSVSEFLDVCKKHGVRELDTARVYNTGKSEELLGAVAAYKDFAVSTKAPAFSPGSLSYEKITTNCHKSLEALQQEKVDIYYLHGPDGQTPFEEQCKAINDLYKQGKFKRFGVSNLTERAVKRVYDICKENGYIMPTVYQGAYNPIFRGPEKTLIPLLKEKGLAYYIFSPLAGGLLAKKIEEVINPANGSRFKEMPVFGDIYLRPKSIAALAKFKEACDEEGISVMEGTLRWEKHHSPLTEEDAIILGASSSQQVDATLTAAEKGPLPEKLVEVINKMWDSVKDNSFPYANEP